MQYDNQTVETTRQYARSKPSLQSATDSLGRYRRLLDNPIEFAKYVLDRLERYEKVSGPMQPDILLGEQPSSIAVLLRKDKNHRSKEENQLVNAWRHWRDEVWGAEGENESRLRSLFRALIIFNREMEAAREDVIKNKHLGCITLIDNFLKDIWQIHGAYASVLSKSWFDLTKQYRHVYGFSNEWRDPVSCEK